MNEPVYETNTQIKEEIWIQNDEAISPSHLLHNAQYHGISHKIDTGLAWGDW